MNADVLRISGPARHDPGSVIRHNRGLWVVLSCEVYMRTSLFRLFDLELRAATPEEVLVYEVMES